MVPLFQIESLVHLAQETSIKVLKDLICGFITTVPVLSQKSNRKTRKVSFVNHLVRKVLSQVPCLAGSKTAWEQQTILPNYQKWLSLDNGLTTHIINRINVGRILWIFTFLRSPPKRNRAVPLCEQKILLTLHAVKRAQECGPLKDNCQQETEPETPPLPDEEAVCGAFW